MLINESELKKELEQAIESFKKKLASIRTGKANPSDYDSVMVEAYGGMNPLNTMGQIVAEDAMTLKVNVWDKSIVPAVEKALREADLGGSVANSGDSIRIKFAPLTEEDRKSKVKDLGDVAEHFRVRVRQVRQKFMKQIEGMEGVSEDDQERDQKNVQSQIDKKIEEIDSLTEKKEQELLKI